MGYRQIPTEGLKVLELGGQTVGGIDSLIINRECGLDGVKVFQERTENQRLKALFISARISKKNS